MTCTHTRTHTHVHGSLAYTHTHHPPAGHQAAKWGVKYNFRACWWPLIKHFPWQLPRASYSLAFDTPCPLPALKGLPLHRRGSGLSIRAALTCASQALWCSRPPSESTKEQPAQTDPGRTGSALLQL